MVDLPSRTDLFEVGADVIRDEATRIDPAQILTAGSDVNILLASMAKMSEVVVRQLGTELGNLLLDVASGEALDRYAWDRHQVARKGASAALGAVTIARVSAAAGAGTVASGTRVRTDTGIEYVTLAAVAFGGADVGPHDVDVRAVEAGKETQVAAGAINAFSQQPFDPTLTVTNEDATAGGEERESDALFRERVRDSFRTARRGVLAAIEQGALAVPGVTSARAVELVDEDGIPQRFVELFVADSDGLASTALATKVEVSLGEYRACGIYVRVSTSAPVMVEVLLRLRFEAGVDTLSLSESVRNAVVAQVNSLGTQRSLLVSDITATLARFKPEGLIVESDAVVAPVGDVVPASGQTIRTTLDRVTVE